MSGRHDALALGCLVVEKIVTTLRDPPEEGEISVSVMAILRQP